MDDASDVVGADYVFDLVVITDIGFDEWKLDVVFCAQVDDAGFEALVERVIDDDVLAAADEFISYMCADVSSASGK